MSIDVAWSKAVDKIVAERATGRPGPECFSASELASMYEWSNNKADHFLRRNSAAFGRAKRGVQTWWRVKAGKR